MYPREVTVSKINATELHSFIHYKHDQVNVSNVTLELSVSQQIKHKLYVELHICENYMYMCNKGFHSLYLCKSVSLITTEYHTRFQYCTIDSSN